MANTLKFGNGNWATKDGSTLAYNDESGFNPLPFDFTRASSATVVNKNGLIETVASGIPRIDFKDNTKGALLLEPSRTNSIANSNFQSGWSILSGGSFIYNQSISPDGTQNAVTLTGNGSASNAPYIGVSVANGTSYAFSVFVKPILVTSFQMIGFSSEAGGTVKFDLSNGTVITESNDDLSSAKIEDYGNGWYRCSVIATADGTGTALFGFNSELNINGNNFYIYGAQFEEGSYATSLINTSGSAVTREAEKCENNLSNVVSLTEGVIFIDTTNLGNDGTNSNIISQSSSVDTVFCLKVGSNNKILMGLFASSVNIPITSTSAFPLGTRTKIAFHYKSGNTKLYINGSLEGTNNAAFTLGSGFATALRLIDTSTAYNAFPQKSIAREFKVYNNGLTDAELIALTSI